MGTATISLDRFRRARATDAAAGELQVADSAHVPAHPLLGAALGLVQRTYGLMKSDQVVSVSDVLSASGDLAVADRLAFVASLDRHEPIAVVHFEGWFLVCATDVPLDPATLAQLRELPGGAPTHRLMSIACDRGITPALGPLACA
jgi:hypothetical protein